MDARIHLTVAWSESRQAMGSRQAPRAGMSRGRMAESSAGVRFIRCTS